MDWEKNADLLDSLAHRIYNDPELMSLIPFDEWNTLLQVSERLKRLADGRDLKHVDSQLVIFNYRWYIDHKWEWPNENH